MDSAAVRAQVLAGVQAGRSVDEILAVWDMPGRIALRPSGRLRIDAPCSGKERYLKQATRDKAPPSPFRVDRWRELRQWEALEPELDPEKWRSLRELLELDRLREAGAQHVPFIAHLAERLDPEEDAELLAVLLAGGCLTDRLLLFAAHVHYACHVQGRPFVVGTLQDLAELLRCSPRQAFAIRRTAERKKLVERIPNFVRYPQGFEDREGKTRKTVRTSNLYRPGLALDVARLRTQGPERPPAPNAPAPQLETARTIAAPEGSREDRTECDPTPRRQKITGCASGPPAALPPLHLHPPSTTSATPCPPRAPTDDSGQARADGASQPLPRDVPCHASEIAAQARLTRPTCKRDATVGTTPAARPAPRHVVISPTEADRMPSWYTAELSRAIAGASDVGAAMVDVLEQASVWLRLTEGGLPAAEADAVVTQLRAEQERRRKEAARPRFAQGKEAGP